MELSRNSRTLATPCCVSSNIAILHLQLVGANDDGKLFDEQDAQLDLSAGQPRWASTIASQATAPRLLAAMLPRLRLCPCQCPRILPSSTHPAAQCDCMCAVLATCRFYIMRLPRRGRRFERITYHAKVTQCLGGLQVSLLIMLAFIGFMCLDT